MLKKFFKITAGIFSLVILLFVLFVAYITLTDYKPPEAIPLETENNQKPAILIGKPLSVLTFNIGYCGLDKNQDFFMDGGTMSRSSSRKQTLSNLDEIGKIIGSEKADFSLLQEVDVRASRSYYINQLEYLGKKFTSYGLNFGLNYDVLWVPVPLTNPMGTVESGLVTMSRFNIGTSTRYQYPGHEKWPTQLFELDRCFVENRLPVEGGKELVLINSHLSAFDKGGEIRKQQLAYLKAHITAEYDKGNYVIIAGDWNHSLPGTDPGTFKFQEEWPFWLQDLPEEFTPQGFQWAVDKTVPTVRTVAKAYIKDVNFTAIIDGFLVSPNIEIVKVYGHSLEFRNSDHNPVTGIFQLK